MAVTPSILRVPFPNGLIFCTKISSFLIFIIIKDVIFFVIAPINFWSENSIHALNGDGLVSILTILL